jgi:lycopene cyclase domain-containing protein
MTHWPYLPFLLVWALPVLALQWLAGGRYLWRARRLWPWVVLALGAYFSLADAVAIRVRIWSFDARALTGFYLGPVPLEEALFYLLTAAMVVQGFVIAWLAWDERGLLLARWQGRLARLRGAERRGTPQQSIEETHPARSVDGRDW